MKKRDYCIERIYGYCRWIYKYPPDSWCLIGIHIYWMSYRNVEYRLCLFGFELRFHVIKK